MESSPAKPETAVSIQKDDKVHIIGLSHDESRAIFQAFEGQVPTSIHCNIQPSQNVISYAAFEYECALKSLAVGVDIFRQALSDLSLNVADIFSGGTRLLPPTVKFAAHVTIRFKYVFSSFLLKFMFDDEFMQFVGRHCNEDVTYVYYLLACVTEHYDYGVPSYTSAVLAILKHIGDNGCYVWLHILHRCGCELVMCPSLMEYMVDHQGLSMFYVAMENPKLLPNEYVIGTNPNKRQRSE